MILPLFVAPFRVSGARWPSGMCQRLVPATAGAPSDVPFLGGIFAGQKEVETTGRI